MSLNCNAPVVNDHFFHFCEHTMSSSRFSSNEKVHQLEVISRLPEAKLKALEDIGQDILSLCNVDEIPQEIEESERYVEKVITCQKKISNVSQPTAGDMQEPPDPAHLRA